MMKGVSRMKFTIISIATAVLLSASVFAGELVNVSGASKIALSGYDPVAFFVHGKAVNGSPFITAENLGATYLFASEEHRKLFTENPAKYAPQFGGFCAYGVALRKLFPVDINTWQVRDGKLYLNLNPDILEKFNADFGGNRPKAEQNWPELVKKSGK
jgi:YHS domain-containing protein